MNGDIELAALALAAGIVVASAILGIAIVMPLDGYERTLYEPLKVPYNSVP